MSHKWKTGEKSLTVTFWDHVTIRFMKCWKMDVILLPLIPCSWAMKSRNLGNDNWWPYWVSERPRKCNFRAENEKIFHLLFSPKGFMKCLLSPWHYLGCDITLFKLIQFQFLYNSGFKLGNHRSIGVWIRFRGSVKFPHFYIHDLLKRGSRD